MGCVGAQGGGWATCWGSKGAQSAELGSYPQKLPLGAGFGAGQGRGVGVCAVSAVLAWSVMAAGKFFLDSETEL